MGKTRSPTEPIEWYSATQAARIAGLSLDMVNYLCRHEYVEPSYVAKRGEAARGYGVARKYTYSDVLLLRVMAKLLKRGISVKELGKSLATLKRRGKRTSDLVAKKYLLTDGVKIYGQDDATLEMLDSGQLAFAFILELGSVRQEVDAKIGGKRRAG